MTALRRFSLQNPFDISLMEDFDDYEADLVGMGSSAAVMAVNGAWVVKIFADGVKRTQDLNREVEIFEKLKLGRWSPYVVQYIMQWDRGIVMERLDMTLRRRLRLPNITISLRDRWMEETCEGIAFLHSEGIIHGDIGCQNILIDSDGHAKICDFAGSKIGDEESWICYQVRNQHPDYIGQQPTIKTELFALGSVIFEISTSKQPYEHLSDSIVEKNFAQKKLPLMEVSRPEIRKVVERCWKGSYVNIDELCVDLKSL